ncbi:MAG TPA: peptidoglycan-binding domain-containing protein [Candidatus Limnocylindrales bacterium]|nr:peptidoglycan-binding domain-containing protein [Candidatus Limnocylindrales bacterium]
MTTRRHQTASTVRRWGYGLAVLCLAATTAMVGIATPAYAATPDCDTYGWFWPGNDSRISLKLPVDTDLRVAYGEWRCTMRYSNTGEDVWTLQEGLNLCYGTNTGRNLGINLRQDGQFGPATRAALVKVQQYHRISADGIYGPQTARTILHKGRAATPYGTFDVCATTAQAGVG